MSLAPWVPFPGSLEIDRALRDRFGPTSHSIHFLKALRLLHVADDILNKKGTTIIAGDSPCLNEMIRVW